MPALILMSPTSSPLIGSGSYGSIELLSYAQPDTETRIRKPGVRPKPNLVLRGEIHSYKLKSPNCSTQDSELCGLLLHELAVTPAYIGPQYALGVFCLQ